MTLHVGPGTFRPVRAERVAEHRVEAERFEVSEATAAAVDARAGARAAAWWRWGRRPSARSRPRPARMAAWPRAPAGRISPSCPGTEFRAVDALLTNFHLPRSSLLLLVSAFAGRERVLDAYAHAVAAGYRFYSYGDAMLIPWGQTLTC